jgi:hypothetical protein
MITVGTFGNDTPSLNVTLASNANSKLFADNTLTSFTNALPFSIGPGRNVHELFVQLKNISISKSLIARYRKKKIGYPLMMVYLRELENQMVGNSYLPLLCSVDMNQVVSDTRSVYGPYAVIDFDKSPILKLSKTFFQNLSITITDDKGQPYPLATGPPTLIQLTISCANMDREFTITCLSHPAGNELFPNNTPTEFHSQLHRSMELSNWEVALASIAIPRHIDNDTKFWVMITAADNIDPHSFRAAPHENRVLITGTLETIKTFKDFAEKYRDAMANNVNIGGQLSLRGPDWDDEDWHFESFDDTRCYEIAFNAPAAYLLGYELKPEFIRVEKAMVRHNQVLPVKVDIFGPNWVPKSEDQRFVGVTADMLMVYCDKIKTSIVGHSSVPLLSIVPLAWNSSSLKRAGAGLPSQVMYEPIHLMYRDVAEGNITDLGFSLRRGDGQLIDVKEETENHFKETGGTMITLRFRPKRMPVVAQQSGLTYERKWSAASHYGPGAYL